MDGSDTKSPEIREFTVKAAESATIGQNFRLPAGIASGETLYVFVRAIPYDMKTGANLFDSDIAPWNNATMMRQYDQRDRCSSHVYPFATSAWRP
jgi:hypothetical protein